MGVVSEAGMSSYQQWRLMLKVGATKEMMIDNNCSVPIRWSFRYGAIVYRSLVSLIAAEGVRRAVVKLTISRHHKSPGDRRQKSC